MAEFISIEKDCTRMPFSRDVMKKCEKFSCGNQDLDDFFQGDVFLYEDEMIGKSYCWVTNSRPHHIVALITVSNDSIKSSVLPSNSRNRLNRIFDNQKRNLTYPATLIGRLGVNTIFQRSHVGTQVMDYVKKLNIARLNTNGCRFLVVDAYNNDITIRYYLNNGFNFMHKDESVERIALRQYNERGELVHEVSSSEPLNTRIMYFDLKQLAVQNL